MDTYIQLERRFAPYTAGVDRDSLGMYASSEFYARLTWKDILKHRCTVIIGAGGTGKTRELRQQVVSLRAQGKAAFFCRLEDLASLPLASALEEGTPQELETWLRAADEGWFFLDAVNEAKLVNVRHFEMAIRKFLEVTAPHLPRAHIVISTRPHAWEAYGDLAMLCEKLNLRVLAPGEGERSLPDNDDTAQAPTVDTTSGQHADTALNPLPDKQEPLHTVTLASLSAADVRTFALALGVEVADMQPFMDEVEQSNADLYVSRPADLPGIVDIWKKTRKIGSTATSSCTTSPSNSRTLTPATSRLPPSHPSVPFAARSGSQRPPPCPGAPRFSSLTARPSRPRSGTNCWTRKISCWIGAQPKCRSC